MEELLVTHFTDRKGDLFPGTLAMLILKALSRESMHGAAVAKFIEETSQQIFIVEEGALYPALHRLESRGLIEFQWGASHNKRRAKFYRLTPAGAKELSDQNARWSCVTEAIRQIMEIA